MAYIDRCKLLKDLCKTSAPTPGESWMVGKCIEIVNKQPSADVVPKSEVEELKVMLEINNKAYESLRELYHIDTNALVEARRKTEVEVAREIFEEIKARSMYDFPKMYYTISRMALDELEIKYTEGKDEKGSN